MIVAFGKRLAEADAAHFDTRSGAEGDATSTRSERRARLDRVDQELREAGM